MGGLPGRTHAKSAVAYWNKRHVEPMPGSIIYVASRTPSGVRRLMPLTPTFFRSDAADTSIMKKRHLLSLLALALAQLATAKHILRPLVRRSRFRWRRIITNSHRAYGTGRGLSLNYRDNDQYRYYSASVQLSRGWKQRCATPTCAPGSTAGRSVLWRSNV